MIDKTKMEANEPSTEMKAKTMFKEDFESVYNIISTHRNRVVKQLNGESIMMAWEVGGFISGKLRTSAWGSGVVRQLAEYIHTQDPTVRGWSYRTIYRMVNFYEAYSSPAFIELVGKVSPQFLPFEIAQIPNHQIVTIESAQIQTHQNVTIELSQIPTVLFSTSWSNHQLIMNYCKTDEQRLFYMLYAGREHLEYKELTRAIKTDAMSAILGGQHVQSQMLQTKYPQAPLLFKDRVSLDMLGLPLRYKEQLQVGGVIQRSLVEFCKVLDNSKK